MKANLTRGRLSADDILGEIELELLQGHISRDDLGRGLQEIRQFHGKTRSDFMAASAQKVDYQEIATRQFQINEMLLTLFQETIGKVQALQGELRKSLRFAQSFQNTPERSQPASDASLPPSSQIREVTWTRGNEPMALDGALSLPFFSEDVSSQLDELRQAMREDKLALEMDVRAVNLPLIGGLLTRLRSMLHSLSLFYANRLGQQQSAVNRLYGDWLLQEYTRNQAQQQEIDELRVELIQLKEQIEELQAQR